MPPGGEGSTWLTAVTDRFGSAPVRQHSVVGRIHAPLAGRHSFAAGAAARMARQLSPTHHATIRQAICYTSLH